VNTTNTAVQLKLKVTPQRPALLAGFDNTVDILIEIEGPEVPADKLARTPLNLALVLDRSGSMSGRPLDEAVRCARFIVESLNESDRAALIVYDDDVKVLVANKELKNKSHFLKALETINVGGNTDLHSGWLKGAQETASYVSPNCFSRVLLLSDGQANRGLIKLDAITQQCSQLAETGVSTSTYGLGYQFNEDLMVRMARAGGGNSYYGETADDLMEPFQRELDLLSALYAKQVRLRLQARPGVEMLVLNPYLHKDAVYVLPDIAYSGVAWAIVRLKVPAALSGIGDGSVTSLADVIVNANDMNGQALELSSTNIALASLVPQAWNSISEDESVRRRAGELEAAAIQDQARRAARHNDWSTVRRLLDEARLKAPGNPWVSAVLDTLENLARQEDQIRFSKEALYSSHSMSIRLSSPVESADFNPLVEQNSLSYLRRKTGQGKADVITDDPRENDKHPGKPVNANNSTAQQEPTNNPTPNRIAQFFKWIKTAAGRDN
jgi:Ca-activated chloride channel family protein